MGFRELTMTDVREVLRRWQSGQSAREIARNGVADRKTAGRYIEAALACGLATDSELSDGVVAEVAQRVQARPLPPPTQVRNELELHRTRIERWLGGDPPLRLVRVHELLARDGISIAYTTLRRFAHETLGWRERPVTVRVDDPPPADEAQIDFGEMGYVAEDDGTRRKLWVLVVTLSMSRYMFVWPTFVQTCAALIEGLEAAWRFFGGVIKRVVPDNMTSAVVHPHPTEPVLNRAFLEYAQWRGFFVDPARVRHPQDKPRVENQVAYVRERWFAGEKFRADLDELRDAARRWCRDVVRNATRPRSPSSHDAPHPARVPFGPARAMLDEQLGRRGACGNSRPRARRKGRAERLRRELPDRLPARRAGARGDRAREVQADRERDDD